MMPLPRPDHDEPANQPLWRSLPLRVLLAAIPLGLTATILLFNVTWATKLLIAIVFGVSLAAPAAGLLLTAVLAPLGQLIAPLVGMTDFRVGEAIVLAFLAGWLLRGLPDRPGPASAGSRAAWLLGATVIGSVLGLAWQLHGYPGELRYALDQLAHLYFFIDDPIGFIAGARLLEGLGLAAATVMIFRRRPALAVTLPAALAGSASLAALSSVLLWRGIGTTVALERYERIGYRVSGHIGDVNAAGSYFAMTLCLAIGMAVRERGLRRALWLGLAGASGVGLWFSESKSAMAAAGGVIVLAAAWAATRTFSGRARAAMLAALIVALLGAGLVRARLLDSDPTFRGGGFRQQFTGVSLRMMRARPLFGVGIGQYYRMSPLFLSPQLGWTYGVENAHNYFLQVGGELGAVGLGLFAIWMVAAAAVVARALARAPLDARLLGVAGGAAALVITCLTGHPLLIGEVAYPFWIQFGLMTALAGSVLWNAAPAPNTPRASSRWMVITASAVLVAATVLTAADAVNPPASAAVDGFYGWETLPDGVRFRWTGEYASLFVPADVTRVYIPARLPTNGRTIRPMGVEVMTAGTGQGRTLVDDTWAIINVKLPDTTPPTRFKRVDLKVDRTWQPALYVAGSADMRFVGVQIGELQLIRE